MLWWGCVFCGGSKRNESEAVRSVAGYRTPWMDGPAGARLLRRGSVVDSTRQRG